MASTSLTRLIALARTLLSTMASTRLTRLLVLALLVLLQVEALINATGARVITKEELASKTGNATDEIWIGILGEVYDVSKGFQYYSARAPYSVFAGRDGSAAFITGNFTAEGAEAGLFEALTPKQIYQLDDWRQFYEKEEKYPFVGVLEGELYDKDGNPTEQHQRVVEAIAEGKVEMDKIKKEREEKIAERKRKAAAEKEAAEAKEAEL